jgi:hypothetical protein
MDGPQAILFGERLLGVLAEAGLPPGEGPAEAMSTSVTTAWGKDRASSTACHRARLGQRPPATRRVVPVT